MPKFSQFSLNNIRTIDPGLESVLMVAIKDMDLRVTCGHRSEQEQTAAFLAGHSKLQWPNSKHNKFPSLAVDVCPYPIDWNDLDRFLMMIGFLKGIGYEKGIRLRSGIDWDNDWDIKDTTFFDYPHIELLEDE